MDIYKTWADLKQLALSKTLPFQYTESLLRYEIFITEGPITYLTQIWIDTTNVLGVDIGQNNIDKTDWETNYKPSANGSLVSQVNITAGVTAALQRYRPRFYNSNSDIALSQATDTELANISIDGKLDAISVNFTRDDIEFVLEVDGVEVLRVNLEELKRTSDYDLKATGGDDDD